MVIRPDIAEFNLSCRWTRLFYRTQRKPSMCIIDHQYWNLYDPFFKEFHKLMRHNPPSVVPPDRGVHHEIDMVHETNNLVTWQRTLRKEHCDVINETENGTWDNIRTPHRKYLWKFQSVSGVFCMLITNLTRPRFQHRNRVLERMVVRWGLHSTQSMNITHCSCRWVIFCWQKW